MKSHIDIKNNGKSLALKPDSSLSVTENNPFFRSDEAYTLPLEIPFEKNRHLLKNYDDINSNIRAMDFENKEVDIVLGGIPFKKLYINVQEESEVKDALSVNFDSRQGTLDALVKDLNCQDIPLKDKIQIGEKIGNVEIEGLVQINAGFETVFGGEKGYDLLNWPYKGELEPQALGFSYPGECYVEEDGYTAVPNDDGVSEKMYPDNHTVKVPKVKTSFINVSEPYGSTVNSPYKDNNGNTIGWPFCNARVCYTHYDVKKNDDGTEETSDSVVEAKNGMFTAEDFGPYWVLDANRPQSGICFYVLYFLDCLFEYLGLSFDKSELMEIEDFKHLVFFTTKCSYDAEYDGGYEFETISTFDHSVNYFEKINKWLESRGCGGKLRWKIIERRKTLEKYDNSNNPLLAPGRNRYIWELGELPIWNGQPYGNDKITSIWTTSQNNGVATIRAKVLKMYANSKNFPDADVSSVLTSLENTFGMRFMYNPQEHSVKASLFRNIFRSSKRPIPFKGKVIDMVPMTEKITGVRMCYSAESDKKEQERYVRNGVRDYDTDYNYNDYKPEMIVLDKQYKEFFKSLSLTDMHVYVDLQTGNAYRIKINSEATSIDTMSPVMFEVGQFKGIEVGDCSDENEDYVKEFASDFTPVAFSDVNYFRETGDPSAAQPLLAAFIDEQMEHEFVKSELQSAIDMLYANVAWIEELRLVESYDPSQTKDGNSPLQEIDWGLSIAMMRGGGTDMQVINYDYDYDQMGNSRWKTLAGKYALASDTMDHFGNEFDYNGTEEGDGGGDRFSLKIRAWKPFLYYIDGNGDYHYTKDLSLLGQPVEDGSQYTWLCPCVDDERNQQGIITRRIRNRGVADVFMTEYIRFLLQRKPFKVKVKAEIAQLLDIKNHWGDRYEINGKIGWFDRLQYNIDVEKGLADIELYFFAI